MIVLVADKFESSGLEALTELGCQVVYQPEASGDALERALISSEADVLIVRSTRVTAEMFGSGRLSLIVRAGAGVNTIDVDGAAANGIYVANCPGQNAHAVAELVFGLILSLDRRIPDNVAALREGRWDKRGFSGGSGLYGRVLGVLGLGMIGREVIRRAWAFGLDVVAWSRRTDGRSGEVGDALLRALSLQPGPSERLVLAPTPRLVAEQVDILSVHLALTDETRGLLDEEVLSGLKPEGMFINTARAELVDEDALFRLAKSRRWRVGVDVYREEPRARKGTFTCAGVKLPWFYGTHHIGASTKQAQEAVAREAVRIVAEYQSSGRVPNVVNLAAQTAATHTLVVRHKDRPGVLAHVFEHLRAVGLNVQETKNVIFTGARAAVARINIDGAPSPTTLKKIADGNSNILDLQLIERCVSTGKRGVKVAHGQDIDGGMGA